MLRFTTFVAIAIAANTGPVLAAPVKDYFEGDGERFEYTTELRADGVIHFDGIVLGSRQQFVLDVAPTGHVTGSFGYTPVEYDVGKKLRDRVAANLAETPAFASAK